MAKSKGKELTAKQRAFVEAYDGNATQAALKAGYSPKTAGAIGDENLKKPEIAQAIRAREGEKLRPLIADREQRQRFWTETMLNLDAELRDRLRASELLGRSEGDFLDRIEGRFDGKLEIAWQK